MTSKPILKLVFIGDFNSGKTSLIQRYVHKRYDENAPPTIGVDFLRKEVKVDNEQVILYVCDTYFWDTYTEERYQSLNSIYYRGADCLLLCFDVNSKESFENINKWKDEALLNKGDLKPPIILFGCKIDLEDKRQVLKESIEKWCIDNNNIPYFETSSKDNINIDTAFETVSKMAFDFYIIKKSIITTTNGSIIKISNNPQNRPNCDCPGKCAFS